MEFRWISDTPNTRELNDNRTDIKKELIHIILYGNNQPEQDTHLQSIVDTDSLFSDSTIISDLTEADSIPMISGRQTQYPTIPNQILPNRSTSTYVNSLLPETPQSYMSSYPCVFKIHVLELQVFTRVLSSFFSIKNFRAGRRLINITLYCQRRKTNNCLYQISLKQEYNTELFTIELRNRHVAGCIRDYLFFEKSSLLRLYQIKDRDNMTFKTAINIMLTEGINTKLLYHKLAYLWRKHEKTLGLNDQMITYSFLSNYVASMQYENDDRYYCISHIISPSNILIMISTRTLLASAEKYDNFCIDATYRLSRMGLILVVFGAIKETKKFHMICFAIVQSENTTTYNWIFEKLIYHFLDFNIVCNPTSIIADSAQSISNAIATNFPSSLRINCWAHVARKLRSKIPGNNVELKKALYCDLMTLQRSITRIVFIKAARSFNSAWMHLSNYEEFIEFFNINYMEFNSNWWEGVDLWAPKTNNHLEGYNSALKRSVFEYRKTAIIYMIQRLGREVNDKTQQYIENGFLEASKIVYDNKNRKSFNVYLLGSIETKIFYLIRNIERNSQENVMSIDDIKGYMFGTKDFADFSAVRRLYMETFVVHRADAPEEWNSFYCSCYFFKKYRKCDHVHYIAIDYLKMSNLHYYIGSAQRRGINRAIERNASLRKE